MISGLYTAASGLIAQTHQQDVIANNMANVNTNGYKKDTALFVPFPTVFLNRINDNVTSFPGGTIDTMSPIGQMGRGVQLRVDGIQPNITEEGSYINTGNSLNFAVKGDAMFTVMTPNGIRYTRDGSFSTNAENKLVTQSGASVIGIRGEIIIDGSDIYADENGIIYVDGEETDSFRLGLFDAATPLRKEGDNLFYTLDGGMLADDPDPGTIQIMQGYIEGSNVNVIREMVDMITAYRAYEASQKAIQAQDQTLNRAVNDVGQVQL